MNRPSTQFPHVVIPRSEHSISRAGISPNALKVLYRLKEAGYQGFLVGGAVRDLLLGITPKDFDVATNALPEEVRRLFRNCRLIGRRFRPGPLVLGPDESIGRLPPSWARISAMAPRILPRSCS